MRDIDKKELESGRSPLEVLEGVDYCLDALFKETEKGIDDFVVKGLKFEELVGILLVVKDELKGR
ncbi:hypothetical protein [Shewanella nanhaiensis]|uniref:Uncharacterized protein n=1 Tax=Shewanella nanhaiensis TaxID=2864872 RepID=A0ABS7E731_9GAMM|nr:hypothetical protein [Shewanella nanhaiensis]MBW8185504.1 hypothetical protein [Shewanella nanhaiensis]